MYASFSYLSWRVTLTNGLGSLQSVTQSHQTEEQDSNLSEGQLRCLAYTSNPRGTRLNCAKAALGFPFTVSDFYLHTRRTPQ